MIIEVTFFFFNDDIKEIFKICPRVVHLLR